MNIFFTADLHLGHDNIRTYCNRPFSSVEEMDEILIERWNSKIHKNDQVYFLGDFAFKNPELYLPRLNGKIIWVFGNHDKNLRRLVKGFELLRVKSQGSYPDLILCHYAMRVWDKSHYGSWHLWGHSHGCLQEFDNSLSFDVGVDAWGFYPVSIEEVSEKMAKKSFIPISRRY